MVKAFPTRHLSLEEMRRVERSVVDRAGALACWRGAQPNPHLFLAAARGLRVDPAHCFVVGDSVWDRSPHSGPVPLGIGLLSGGYGREERERSGAAYRVCVEPAEMLTRPGEVGVRPIR